MPPGCAPGLPRNAGHTLEGFAAQAAATAGVSLMELSPIDEIEVRTRNTSYRITVVADTRHGLVHGGAFFPVPSEAHLNAARWAAAC